MINYRLSYLFEETNRQKLIRLTNLEEETLKIELTKINHFCEKKLGQKINISGEEILVPEAIRRRWSEVLFEVSKQELYFSEEERQAMIYLLAFSMVDDLSVYYFQELFNVSKNTVLKDVRNLRMKLQEEDIRLIYSRKKGFYIDGAELDVRRVAYSTVGVLTDTKNGHWLLFEGIYGISRTNYVVVRDRLLRILEEFDLIIVPSRFEEMLYFISFLLSRITKKAVFLTEKDKEMLTSLNVYQASKKFLTDFGQIKNQVEEECYLTVLLKTVLQGDIEDHSVEFLLECAREVIHEMEHLSAVRFVDYRKLLMNFFYHLVPAYFRIRYRFTLNNVLIDEIKTQYRELFELTRLALYPLKQLVGEIPDTEIGYFTILFGGEIRKQKERHHYQRLKAMIVCPSGISSGLIMESELQELFPQIEFLPARSTEEYQMLRFSEDIDMVFSSVPLKTPVTSYVVKPIMTPLEKNELVKKVQQAFYVSERGVHSIEEILEVIFPYIDLKEGMTKRKLRQIVERKINKELNRREDQRPMLSELLTKETIQFTDKQLTWQEAITEAAQPLLTTNKIEEKYVGAMIEKVMEHGPFIHIGKGIALPHARPEDGVKEIGMSLLKVTDPVLLSDDEKHPIQLFICLAAVDNEMHLKALASLTKILSNKERLASLLEAKDVEEIIHVIKEGEDEK
ncbi:hypothetical protein IGJ91_001407 [Enterococcus sp. DIV0765f]|uniref:BglG family transcription antiterminator n=1 Tax=Enterococcus TaxID=1350 RepID=UPI001FB9B59A|nr:BglG family transcription antiterminator [Enterococcus mundtii]GKS54865.1 phosphoenolpyruvate-dependent sugar phosphotransferase system, EIIA 2 [Enterococcus mundtii]